jgi:hypothetical protein
MGNKRRRDALASGEGPRVGLGDCPCDHDVIFDPKAQHTEPSGAPSPEPRAPSPEPGEGAIAIALHITSTLPGRAMERSGPYDPVPR